MKRKWVEGGPSGGPSNPVGKFFINPTDPRTVEELKAIHTQEAEAVYKRSNNQAHSELERIGFDSTTAWNIVEALWRDLAKTITASIPIEFCEMKRVHLENLSNLRSFSSGILVEWQSLENVVVNQCPNFWKFGLEMIKKSQLKSIFIQGNEGHIIDIDNNMVAYLFEFLDDKFSTIIEYNVFDDEELYKTIRNLQSSHFINLRILWTKNCHESLREFLSILLERSHKIEVINIENCKSTRFYLLDTMDEDVDGKFFRAKGTKINKSTFHEMLHQLKELIIEACEVLSTIFKSHDNRPRTKLPLLSKVKFKSLPNLRQICSCHLEFPSLKSLMIEECPILTKFTTGFADPHETLTTDGKSFYELNEIVFDNYDNLVCVISSKTLEELRILEKLFVSRCKELKILFNIHEEISSSTRVLEQLYVLTLIDLPKLSRIVNKEISRFYQNLKILHVKQCKSLDLLQVPQKLTNLEISDCERCWIKLLSLKKKRERKRNSFHELKDVSLENLSKLSIVFPSISEFPSLQTLKITNCSTMRSFVEDSKALKESSATTYFFPSSLLVKKLKELHIINVDVEKLWDYNYPSESFCELENLSLINNNKILSVISSGVIMRFKNLRKLTLDKCESLTEVFDLEDDNLHHKVHEILPQLQILALINLIKLKYVWKKEPQVSFFQNLVSLYVVHCGNLQCLFSLSSIKNLEKLKILRLCKCDKIEEIISSDISEDEKVPIIFPELECVRI
ncbi:putative disease resistance protein At4g19050 [Phaseolus vulgaris]|uniref:putative disease resistance protein At4g19050 n=1 Tax=Phaseolus vulgaris TaxID=3885 RepID=UPI0035CB0EF4